MEVLAGEDEVIRRERELVIRFAGRRRVICTGPFGGGIREDLTAVFNHCDADPDSGLCIMRGETYAEHLAWAAGAIGLDLAHSAGLSTACRMDRLRMGTCMVQGIPITLFVTAGINRNGRCAGDPTSLWEEKGLFTVLEKPVQPPSGTINLILHIGAGLSEGALAGAVMVLTEAKCSVLFEMGIRSCYSDRQATGSGTDGILVISDPSAPRWFSQIRTDTGIGAAISALVNRVLKETIRISMEEEKKEKEGDGSRNR